MTDDPESLVAELMNVYNFNTNWHELLTLSRAMATGRIAKLIVTEHERDKNDGNFE
jgi:hypothetical protein